MCPAHFFKSFLEVLWEDFVHDVKKKIRKFLMRSK